MLVSQRKSAKVLSPPSCGMSAAMGIGVMRERVPGFLLAPVSRWGAFGLPRRSENCSAEVSGEFLGGFAIGFIAGWQRNELAEAQFNKRSGAGS